MLNHQSFSREIASEQFFGQCLQGDFVDHVNMLLVVLKKSDNGYRLNDLTCAVPVSSTNTRGTMDGNRAEMSAATAT